MVFLGKDFNEKRNYSEKTAELIDSEVAKLVNGALETARDIITKERHKLDLIAETLLKKETLEKEEFEDLMDGKEIKDAE